MENSSIFEIVTKCRHFEATPLACGGCIWQGLSLAEYSARKLAVLRNAFAEQGIELPAELPLHLSSAYSRRRISLSAKQMGRILFFGFHAKKSDQIINLTECQVMHKQLWQHYLGWRTGLEGMLPHGTALDFDFTLADNGVEVLVTGKVSEKLRTDLVALAAAQKLLRISWRGRDRDVAESLANFEQPIVRFGDATVFLPPASFLQSTLEGEAVLREFVATHCGTKGKMLDLYAGCGSLTFALPKKVQRVAVEVSAAAVNALKNAAAQDGGLTAMQRDLARRPLFGDELAGVKTVVIDPPFSGAEEQMAELARAKIPTIIAISCNPKTAARDFKYLVKAGYKLKALQAVDQFVWSAHLELAACWAL